MGQVVYKGPDEAQEIVCSDGSRVIAEKGQPVRVPDEDEKNLLDQREDFGKQVPAKASKKESD